MVRSLETAAIRRLFVIFTRAVSGCEVDKNRIEKDIDVSGMIVDL